MAPAHSIHSGLALLALDEFEGEVRGQSPPWRRAKAPLDAQCYPHIFDLIWSFSGPSSCIRLRATCRALLQRADAELFTHVCLGVRWVDGGEDQYGPTGPKPALTLYSPRITRGRPVRLPLDIDFAVPGWNDGFGRGRDFREIVASWVRANHRPPTRSMITALRREEAARQARIKLAARAREQLARTTIIDWWVDLPKAEHWLDAMCELLDRKHVPFQPDVEGIRIIAEDDYASRRVRFGGPPPLPTLRFPDRRARWPLPAGSYVPSATQMQQPKPECMVSWIQVGGFYLDTQHLQSMMWSLTDAAPRNVVTST